MIFLDRRYDFDREGIIFCGKTNGEKAKFIISNEALKELDSGSGGVNQHYFIDKNKCLQIFKENRSSIYTVAKTKYNRESVDKIIILRSSDFRT